MGHRRQVGDHRVARDILAQDDRQLRGLVGKALRRDQFVQRHHLALGIGQFDADDVAPRNHRDAGRDRRHVACDIVGQRDHAVGLDTGRGLQLVHGNDRAGTDFDDRTLDAEIVEDILQQARIALQRGLVDLPGGGGRRGGQQVEAGQLIGRVAVGRRLGLGGRGGDLAVGDDGGGAILAHRHRLAGQRQRFLFLVVFVVKRLVLIVPGQRLAILAHRPAAAQARQAAFGDVEFQAATPDQRAA